MNKKIIGGLAGLLMIGSAVANNTEKINFINSSQEGGNNSEEFNPFQTKGGNDLTSWNKSLEKQDRVKSNLVKKARVGNNDFVKGIPSNDVGENYNSSSRKTRLQPSTTKRVTPKEPVPNRNLMKMNKPSKGVKKHYVNSKVRTFSSKEEGERKMKEHEERMKGFGSNLKSGEDLPTDITHPMYGLNYFVGAHNPYFYRTFTYGCGKDPNGGDTIITVADLNKMKSLGVSYTPLKDGTWWMDLDRDGVANTILDQERETKYLAGDMTQISIPSLETREEAHENFLKELEIDFTSSINAYDAGWDCNNYGDQTFLNFTGCYDITNSPYAENNGTNLQYDLSLNGVFGRAVRKVTTVTGNEIPHAIISLYNGPKNDQNPKNFEYKIFIEPQTDEIQKIGDFSLNEIAKEGWHGYFNNFFGITYGSIRLCEYELSEGQATLGFYNPDLVLSWTPVDKVVYPEDKNLEYFVGIENLENVETGEPTDILYNETRVGKAVTSEQVMDGSVNQVNYDMNVLWELTTGAYTPQNTLNAIHNQKISVRDNTPSPITGSLEDITAEHGEFDSQINSPFGPDNSGLPTTYSWTKTLTSEDATHKYWNVTHKDVDIANNEGIAYQNGKERKPVGIDDPNGLVRLNKDKTSFYPGDTLFYTCDFSGFTKFDLEMYKRMKGGPAEMSKSYGIKNGKIFLVIPDYMSSGVKTIKTKYIDGGRSKTEENIVVKER